MKFINGFHFKKNQKLPILKSWQEGYFYLLPKKKKEKEKKKKEEPLDNC